MEKRDQKYPIRLSLNERIKDELPVQLKDENPNAYPSKVDVAVLLLFFTRTEHTKITFNQIRKARPSKLFLYQDGPREGRADDIENINKCREVIESMIDWNCEVHRLYQKKNYGCDPSEYLSQKWMFSYVDKGIIIEDDDVMSESFFPFCKELLDKYENDTRINMICGRNQLGKYDAGGADYIFAKGGGIWGWATWKRTIDSWDPQYKFLEDSYAMRCLSKKHGEKSWKRFVNTCRWHKASGKEYYESIRNSNQFVNSQLNIIPSVNMCCNIGISVETTHSVNDICLLPRAMRNSLFASTYDVEFPIKHPNYVIEDQIWQKLYKKKLKGNWIVRTLHLRKIEYGIYKLFPIIGKIGSKKIKDRVKDIMEG